jgi:uncharacterized phage-associated protein
MTSAHDVAKYLIYRAHQEDDDSVSNLKLQKLLYYAQGFHLALFDEPLFSDEIIAWEHGPVVRSVYFTFKDFRRGPIPFQGEPDEELFGPATKELVDEVYNVYGEYSALALRNLSHTEPPWKDTPQNSVIKHHLMREYFKTRLITDDEA